MKKQKKKKTHVPFRLNVMFFVVFILFSALILRLGVVQIVYGDDFKREIERTEDVTINNPVPRGKMFDTSGKIIVDNIPLNAITYTKYQGTDTKEMLKVAEKLATLIQKDTNKIQERDKKDFWIMKHPNLAKKKITKKEWDKFEAKELTDKEIYKLQLERITPEEINSFSNEELEVLAIFREFNSGYALTPQIVKNEGVTAEEFAAVSENLESLPGVDTTTDWKRTYASDTLISVLGKVTTSDEGLPSEQLDYYLSRDYNRNDRVGKSYIEMQYEDVLSGQKAKVRNKTDKAGNVLSAEVVSEGKRGKDLVLSIDMELQLAVEKIIEENLKSTKGMAGTGFLDRAYVVLMDPNTGEILTMAGKRIVKDPETGKTEMQDDALGTFTTSYNVGSAVKGATVLTGYQTGAISPGTVLHDGPLQIKGTPVKKSWTNMGSVNDLKALERSSNVYMFRTAIAIGKGKYVQNGPLSLDSNAFNTIRDSFSQFGLGVRTGIDLPNETAGFKGQDKRPGFLLDLAIGQYDTYSAMQLAQYVSTIANNGYRIQPHIVKEIREPVLDQTELGPITKAITPNILNRVDMKEDWIKRVQQGFHLVMHGAQGTARGFFAGKPYDPAGKTGTAQAFYDGPDRKKYGKEPPEVMNLSLVGYAPFNSPEIAMSVLVPWAYTPSATDTRTNLNIGQQVMDTYFNLKAARQAAAQQNPDPNQNVTQENQNAAQ
ncbi:penicillin-binding protein 2 [Bacillus sp. DNRA2]|uniref:peptidoglycan D,D-transpeptidase FtsI family protein n=1 Tax=Bacillus sp. DNRA2 TaxID=2723053 RepID=UPI00145E49DF|nr:penicillin-binding protein 2 [Bacillus sp. DNRA2]NMD71859.1 penicillin-binding protein 2 [Bacillus sp. DNRA2]